MKSFNKWMVVPFEENKVQSPDSDQVNHLFEIDLTFSNSD